MPHEVGKKNRNRSVTGRKITGFTLVELIVAITILAILATIPS